MNKRISYSERTKTLTFELPEESSETVKTFVVTELIGEKEIKSHVKQISDRAKFLKESLEKQQRLLEAKKKTVDEIKQRELTPEEKEFEKTLEKVINYRENKKVEDEYKSMLQNKEDAEQELKDREWILEQIRTKVKNIKF